MKRIKPLFIPLNTEYYRAFERGEKDCGIRLYGKRWNRKTCYEGRPVTLSMGYGKQNRLTGVVTKVTVSEGIFLSDELKVILDTLYGSYHQDFILIHIEVDRTPGLLAAIENIPNE